MGKRNKYDHEINPDEIFLDSRNFPEFDRHQFEGRIERPISRNAVLFLSAVFLVAGLVFIGRLMQLQVVEGAVYRERSEQNNLRHTPLFSSRGIIYDRNGKELAWNEPSKEDFPDRRYIESPGLAHVLGYVNYPKKDSSGKYYQTTFIGKDGIEAYYNDALAGTEGVKITEVNVFGDIESESVIYTPEPGKNITLSIDARVQSELSRQIEALAKEADFSGGAGVILDVKSGEVLALTSYPEYDPNILSRGTEPAVIQNYITDPATPFLNRAVSGLYTPGSTVKPFFGIAALNEHVISPLKKIFSSGSISVENPYSPGQETVFNDWRAHGWVDLRKALAVSSNVYFFEVGGGYEDQQGLGIRRLEEYARMFGLGEITGIDIPGETEGVIPDPEWKAEHFNGDEWRIGDTYNTAIGQYGFQITPLQLARGIATIASGGMVVKPHLVVAVGDAQTEPESGIVGRLDIPEEHFQVIREGLRQGVTEGISQVLNISEVAVAAKTGTAEVDSAKKYANSWVSGFFPYENPRYAFAVVMEKGPHDNLHGSIFVMRGLLEWMAVHTPEYLE